MLFHSFICFNDLQIGHLVALARKHKIKDDIGIPERDHINFPFVEDTKIAFDERKKERHQICSQVMKILGLKKKSFALEDSSREGTTMKTAKQLSSIVKYGQN